MNKVNLVLLIILLLGLAIRLYKINIPILEFYPSRQIQTADITRNFLQNDFNILNPTVSYYGPGYTPFLIEFAGYNFLIAILYKFFGTIEVIGRYVSLAGWLIATILIYKIALKVGSKTIAHLSALFYCMSPLSVLVSRSFQPDQWMLTFSLGAIYSMLLYKKNKMFYFYLSSILVSASILIKLPAVIFALIPIYYLMLRPKNNISNIHKVIYLLIAILPAILWFTYAYIKNQMGLPTAGNFTISNWFSFEVFLNTRYYLNIFGFQYNLVLLPFGIFLFIFGVFRRPLGGGKFLYFWLASVIIYFLIFNKHAMTHEYYHLPFLPVASIFIGLGSNGIIKGLDNLIVPKYLFLIFLPVILFVLMIPPTLQKAYKPIARFEAVEQTAKAIKAITKPDDLIIGSIDAGPALVYYANRSGWSFEVNRQSDAELLTFFGNKGPASIDPVDELKYLKRKGAVVFASADKSQFLENRNFAEYMMKYYYISQETEKYIIFDLRVPRNN